MLAGVLVLTEPAQAATFTVNTTSDNDDGSCDSEHCSLREAINAANDADRADVISFSIGEGGVATITVGTALPTIIDPVTIDGTTQPGYAGAPLIDLTGADLGGGVTGLALGVGSDGSTIRGLEIFGFPGPGVGIFGSGGNVVYANVIHSNGNDGIQVQTDGNSIGFEGVGNILYGNTNAGVSVSAHLNVIEHNLVGTADGTEASGNELHGISLTGADNTVVDNLISGNDGPGVRISGETATGNLLFDNVIGLTAAGDAALPNAASGVLIQTAATLNVIGGAEEGQPNTISGNTQEGVLISGANDNDVIGNFVGTDATGSVDLGNSQTGIRIVSSAATDIRGNVVSGNGFAGIDIAGPETTGTIIRGNRVGTNAAGNAVIANGAQGIGVQAGASNNLVGGEDPPDANLISGNTAGIYVHSSSSLVVTGNEIIGNLIGTDITGTVELGNAVGVELVTTAESVFGNTVSGNTISGNTRGIHIRGASDNVITANRIGTDVTGTLALDNSIGVDIDPLDPSPATGNVIGPDNVVSGNSSGIEIGGEGAEGNDVVGNLIGTAADGVSPLGNTGTGLFLDSGDNLVEGNTIAFNGAGETGVAVQSGTGNEITENEIFSNVGLGIDLGADGAVLENDLDDEDGGPNDGQNFPELDSAVANEGETVVTGEVPGPTVPTLIIEVFANDECNPSGNGEGQVFLGSVAEEDVEFNSFTFVHPEELPDGTVITATATAFPTEGRGNTSEFSDCIEVTSEARSTLVVNTTDDGDDGSCDSEHCTLREAINAASASTEPQTIVFDPEVFPGTIFVGSALPPLSGDGDTIDALDAGVVVEFAQVIILQEDGEVDGLTIIGSGNTVLGLEITGFSGAGVVVQGGSGDGEIIIEQLTGVENTLSQLSLHGNGGRGIDLRDGGNEDLSAPVIASASGDTAAGTAPAGSTVEIFAADDDEGRTFLGSTVSDSEDGSFLFTGNVFGPFVTATATDADGNTSEFATVVAWVPENCEDNGTFDTACDVATELDFGAPPDSFDSYLSGPGDLDWFFFDLPSVAPGSLLQISLEGTGEGTELPANYDIAVFAELDPEATPLQGVPLQGVPLQGVPLQGVPLQGVDVNDIPLQGVPLQGVPLQGVPLQGVPLQGVPLQGVPLQGVPLQGVGSHLGTQSEEVQVLERAGFSGRIYVLVWSQDGSFSDEAYQVSVQVTPVLIGPCGSGLDPNLLGGSAAPFGDTTDPTTLILWNQPRMVALFGETGVADLQSDLTSFAGHALVDGLVVDLGHSPTQALSDAYAAWDAAGCDLGVVDVLTVEIKKAINALLGANPSVENVVFVGGDTIIPMRRVFDRIIRVTEPPGAVTVPSEFDYQSVNNSTVRVGAVEVDNNPVAATLRASAYLTDDFYLDDAPILLPEGGELSVPDRAGGRLVESPADISAYLQTFLAQDGVVGDDSTMTSLTTGYSFLIDMATAIDGRFGDAGYTRELLANNDWSREDLLSSWVNSPDDLTVIGAHFDHFRLAPAEFFHLSDAGPDDLVTTADLEDALVAGTFVFGPGCHFGLNLADGAVAAGFEAGAADWPQVLVAKGVTSVANWGFGYGDDAVKAYSEELMFDYATELPVAGNLGLNLGQAFMRTKRGYLLSQAVRDAFHEKILQEAVFYGVPNWVLDAPGTPATPPDPIVESFTPDTMGGLPVRNYDLDVDTTQRDLVNVSGRGSYHTLGGDSQSGVYRTVQPVGTVDVGTGVDGQVAHGTLFTGGTYSDQTGFDPVITMPTWDRSAPEPQFLYDDWDPTRFWSLAQLEGSIEEHLVVLTGQFQGDGAATEAAGTTVGRQRLYDSLQFQVIYNSDTAEFDAPLILGVDAAVVSGGVLISVLAEDLGGQEQPPSGVARVLVAFTPETGGSTWQSQELSFNSANGRWEGTVSATGPLQFIVQAVDGAGNVGMFGGYFRPVDIELSGPALAQVGETVTFTAELPAGLVDPVVLWDFGDGAVEEDGDTVDHTYGKEGTFTVTARVRDESGALGMASLDISVVYETEGSYTFVAWVPPVQGEPTVNQVRAPSTVPVKWILHDAFGNVVTNPAAVTDIRSHRATSCTNFEPHPTNPAVVVEDASAVSFDSVGGHFLFEWQTRRQWRGTCRLLILTFADGSTAQARFRFR